MTDTVEVSQEGTEPVDFSFDGVGVATNYSVPDAEEPSEYEREFAAVQVQCRRNISNNQ